MDLIPKLDLVILDCPHALELAHFYSGLLGWPIEDGADPTLRHAKSARGRRDVLPDNPDGRATLAFQRIEDWVVPTSAAGGEHPQQFHLDFSVGAPTTSTLPSRAVLALGARVARASAV